MVGCGHQLRSQGLLNRRHLIEALLQASGWCYVAMVA